MKRMLKANLKRILSVTLAVALILGWHIPESKAEQATVVVNDLYFTENAHANNGRTGIYAIFDASDLSGLTVAPDWTNRFRPADANSGIFVNGSGTAVAYPENHGGYAYQNAVGEAGIYLEQFGTLDVDDYLTVKGTFVSDSTGESFTLAKAIRFVWKGDTDKWVVAHEETAAVNIESLYLTDSAKDASNQKAIYAVFTADDLSGLTIDEWNNRFKPADENSGVFVNGSTIAVAYPQELGGYAYQNALGVAGIYLEQFGTLNVGDYLIVKGTFVSNSTGERFTLAKETKFTWRGETDKWEISYTGVGQEAIIPTDIIFDDLKTTQNESKIEIAAGAEASVGTLGDVSHGFKFKLGGISTANSGKEFKIGFYNPTESIWNGGYHLRLNPLETQGTLDWALINPVTEEQITFGSIMNVPETMEVYAWVSDVTDTGHTLNIIANGQTILMQTMDSTVSLGKNLYAYNGWTSAATVYSFDEQVEEPVNPPVVDTIPADVVFEDLSQTNMVNAVEISALTEGTLGMLSDVTHGFKFKLNGIKKSNAGRELKIGLYSPNASIWDGGYHLRFIPQETEGNVEWAMIDGAGDRQLASGFITGASDTLEVYVWLSNIKSTGHTLNVFINGQRVMSESMDASVVLGDKLYVYNGWNSKAVIHTFDKYEPGQGEDLANSKIPENVVFEDLSLTKKVNKVKVAPKAEGTLGSLSDVTCGFRFKISDIVKKNAEKEVKIGLFNPTESIWGGGYVLRLIPQKTAGTVAWAIIDAKKDEQLAFGVLTNVPKKMEVYTWVSDITKTNHTLNIFANGTMIFSRKMNGKVELGTNLYAYNGWKSKAVFQTFNKTSGAEKITPTGVVFEDLTQTKQVGSVEVAPGTEGILGVLSDISHGFKFKLSGLSKENAGKEIKVGLYNPTESVWNGGYFLRLIPQSASGTVEWAIIDAAKDKQLASGAFTGASETVEIYAWVSNVTAKGHTLNIIANEQMIFSKAMGKSVKLGQNLYAYNGWTNTAVFKAFGEYKKVSAKVPADVTFEDLSNTIQGSTMEIKPKTEGALGSLSDVSHGFKFKLDGINTANAGKEIKIGLFNPKESVWSGGYILRLIPQNVPGTVEWAIIDAVQDKQLVFGAIANVPETLEVYAWMSDVTSANHTLNIIANGQLIISQAMGAGVEIGKNLYVYNGWDNVAVFRAFNEVTIEQAEIPTDIVFEDIGSASLKNEIQVPTATYVTLAILNSENNGFQFIMKTPQGKDYGKSIKIGLYNTDYYPWANGYILRVCPNEDGSILFSLLKGSNEALCAVVPAYTGVAHGEEFKVTVWVSSDPANPGAQTVHVVVNDVALLTYDANDGGVLMGRHITVYSEWDETAIFRSVSKKDTLLDLYLKEFGDPTARTDDGEYSGSGDIGEMGPYAWLLLLGGAVIGALSVMGVNFAKKKRKKQ